MRDPASKFMKAVAFIEFFTVEHATYALQNCRTIQIGRDSVRVAFAREAVMNQLLSQVFYPFITLFVIFLFQLLFQQNFSAVAPGMMGGMPMVANAGNFALQAAQWSMGVPPAGNISSGQTSINYVKPDTTWPPSFENFGGAYTFQPRSGYFYESNSEFYYCPKSKLYYSGKDGYYYSYDNNASPPFVRYYPQAPTEPDTAIPGIALIDKTDEAKSAEANNDAAASRQPISISLGGSFKLKAMKSSAPVKSAGKKALNDIAKWGARLREENDEKNATDDTKKDEMHKEEDPNSAFKKAVKPQQPAISMSLLTQAEMDLLKAGKQRSGTSAPDAFKFNAGGSSGSSTPLPSEKSAAAGTTSSQKVSTTPAICHLCRRQFPSSEVLARHERESKLHAENLLKAEAANSNNT